MLSHSIQLYLTSRIPVDDGLVVARYGSITVSMVYRGHRVAGVRVMARVMLMV